MNKNIDRMIVEYDNGETLKFDEMSMHVLGDLIVKSKSVVRVTMIERMSRRAAIEYLKEFGIDV